MSGGRVVRVRLLGRPYIAVRRHRKPFARVGHRRGYYGVGIGRRRAGSTSKAGADGCVLGARPRIGTPSVRATYKHSKRC